MAAAVQEARPEAAVRIAEWPGDAVSPVCLMVDDLTDGWIDADGRGIASGRNDWGHGLDGPGSSFRTLRDGLLREFPEVHVTFFVPVDRAPDVEPGRFACHYQAIDRRPEFVRFLREIAANPRFELAYHGREHGRPGPTPADYVPEFELHASAAEALSALRAGGQIWKSVFGTPPPGGKYPAYARGPHADIGVDLAGFTWWCRQWDREFAAPDDPAAFRPRFFGEHDVVDVPSTLHGGLLTPPSLRTLTLRSLPYHLLFRVRARTWLDEQLDGLLATRSVITVQEHITSSRPDGDVQTPNVYDDIRSLRHIFSRLRRERVWHATCGEIADYFRARERTRLRSLSRRAFLVSTAAAGEPLAPLSLRLHGLRVGERFRLRGPTGERASPIVGRDNGRTCVTAPLPLEPGRYEILEEA